jgi:hypothetical protein
MRARKAKRAGCAGLRSPPCKRSRSAKKEAILLSIHLFLFHITFCFPLPHLPLIAILDFKPNDSKKFC